MAAEMTREEPAPEVASCSIEAELRDGTAVLLRPVQPDDKHLLSVGMEHLSPQSRYFRFFRPLPEIPPNLLRQFTEIDHVNHEAIGALDVSGADPVPVGVARYIRSPEEKAAAEVAVTVVDSHQGRGLGTLLLAAIAHAAVANGIDQLEAVVLSGNTKMLQVFRELAATMTRRAAGEVQVRLPLHPNASAYPQTPVGDVFRQTFARSGGAVKSVQSPQQRLRPE